MTPSRWRPVRRPAGDSGGPSLPVRRAALLRLLPALLLVVAAPVVLVEGDWLVVPVLLLPLAGWSLAARLRSRRLRPSRAGHAVASDASSAGMVVAVLLLAAAAVGLPACLHPLADHTGAGGGAVAWLLPPALALSGLGTACLLVAARATRA